MHRVTAPEEAPGDAPTTWWLCWQAAIGRDFLHELSLRRRIRERVIDAHERPGRVLLDYVLLPAEIHVLAQVPPGDSVGRIARAIGSILARWVRKAQPIRSPVLAGPYRHLRIESLEELRAEVRMLAWRPVQQGLCRTPTHYAHAALRVALGLTPARGFDSRDLLEIFGPPVLPGRHALRNWVLRRPTDQDWRAWELRHGLVLAQADAVGLPAGKPFMGAAASLIAAAGGYEIEGALKLLETWVSAKLDPTRRLDMHRSSSGLAARARALVACLAVRHGLCSASAVARHFGRAKATLSEQMAACRGQRSDRHILDMPLRRIIEESVALSGNRSPVS